jgi:hypothetical protein
VVGNVTLMVHVTVPLPLAIGALQVCPARLREPRTQAIAIALKRA